MAKMKIFKKNPSITAQEIEKDITDYEFLNEFSLMNGIPRKMTYSVSREGYKWLENNAHTLGSIVARLIPSRWGERWGVFEVKMYADRNDRCLHVEWEKVEP